MILFFYNLYFHSQIKSKKKKKKKSKFKVEQMHFSILPEVLLCCGYKIFNDIGK